MSPVLAGVAASADPGGGFTGGGRGGGPSSVLYFVLGNSLSVCSPLAAPGLVDVDDLLTGRALPGVGRLGVG